MGKILDVVKRNCNKIFRYKLTTVYFMVGQLVVYMAVFGALQIYNLAMYKESDRVSAIYDSKIELEVTTSSPEVEILNVIDEGVEKGNITIAGRFAVEYKEKKQSTRAEIIVADHEVFPYELLEGHIPGSNTYDRERKVVALGRDKYEGAYERDGVKYVTLCSEEYEVVGVLGSESDYWDYKVIFHKDSLGENVKDWLKQKGQCTILLESNKSDMKDVYEKICRNIKAVDPYAQITAKKETGTGQSSVGITFAREKMRVNVVVCIFCFVNCMIVSYFWIFYRKKEIAIRKAFGYSNWKVARLLFKEMMVMMTLSLVLFIVIYAVFYTVVNEYIKIHLDVNLLFTVIAVMLFTSLISIAYPMIRVIRMDVSRGIVER